MTQNVGRGLTRIWIAVVAFAVLPFAVVAISHVYRWFRQNPFDQFDAGYVSLWDRIYWPVLTMIALAVLGYAVWLVDRWIAHGFSN